MVNIHSLFARWGKKGVGIPHLFGILEIPPLLEEKISISPQSGGLHFAVGVPTIQEGGGGIPNLFLGPNLLFHRGVGPGRNVGDP